MLKYEVLRTVKDLNVTKAINKSDELSLPEDTSWCVLKIIKPCLACLIHPTMKCTTCNATICSSCVKALEDKGMFAIIECPKKKGWSQKQLEENFTKSNILIPEVAKNTCIWKRGLDKRPTA